MFSMNYDFVYGTTILTFILVAAVYRETRLGKSGEVISEMD